MLRRHHTHPGLSIGHRAHETKGVGEPYKRVISKCNLESSVDGNGMRFSSAEEYENHISCRVSVICSRCFWSSVKKAIQSTYAHFMISRYDIDGKWV